MDLADKYLDLTDNECGSYWFDFKMSACCNRSYIINAEATNKSSRFLIFDTEADRKKAKSFLQGLIAEFVEGGNDE